jgi:hypothetical protein
LLELHPPANHLHLQHGGALMLILIAECASVVLFIFAMVLLLAAGGMQ